MLSFFSFNKSKKSKGHIAKELERIRNMDFASSGYATGIFEKPFRFHHAGAFLVTYDELFKEEIYKFDPYYLKDGIILDCGANMGLSVLYFAINYPNHHIIAFEPEDATFDCLKENIETFKLKNVTLYKKAVWIKETELVFHSDGGMGGRINNLYKDSSLAVSRVEAVDIKPYLKGNIDFLKLDIEGAEVEVLKNSKKVLKGIKHIFFEYHNDIYTQQALHELLQIMVENGFSYHIKESSTRKRPFVDETIICERFDMALTIFCMPSRK